MWPSSTRLTAHVKRGPCKFQSLKRDVAFFHLILKSPVQVLFPGGFNRSSAMWPSSTLGCVLDRAAYYEFQSFKRDVAFFHTARLAILPYISKVSIAQARCGLLPLMGWKIDTSLLVCFNRSSAMWPSSTICVPAVVMAYREVSIAQARCGLLPQKTSSR